MSTTDRAKISNRRAEAEAKQKKYAEEVMFRDRLYELATKGQKKLGEEDER